MSTTFNDILIFPNIGYYISVDISVIDEYIEYSLSRDIKYFVYSIDGADIRSFNLEMDIREYIE